MSSGSSGVLNAARSSLQHLPARVVGLVLVPAHGLVLVEVAGGPLHERVDPAARDLGLLEQQPEQVRGVREEPALHVSHLHSGVARAPS